MFLARPPTLGRGRCELVLEDHTDIVNAVAVLPDRRAITGRGQPPGQGAVVVGKQRIWAYAGVRSGP